MDGGEAVEAEVVWFAGEQFLYWARVVKFVLFEGGEWCHGDGIVDAACGSVVVHKFGYEVSDFFSRIEEGL